MSQTVMQFWQLAAQSGLLSRARCNEFALAFAEAHAGRQPDSAAELAGFLVRNKTLTTYQAKVLSAGAAGPFDYGDYRVVDRVTIGRLKGLFRAVHRPSGHKVGLWFLPANADAATVSTCKAAAEFHKAIRSRYLSECYGLVESPGFRFVVVEDLPEQTLAETSPSKREAGQAGRLAREIAEGILPLHERGLPHAHVSAENIVLDERGAAKLLSYPLCEVPIAAKADNQPSPVADTRALGRLLLTILDGLEGDSREQLTERLKAISRPESGVPPGIAKCVTRMLGGDQKKLRHAAEVVVALAPFAERMEEAAPPATKAAFEAALAGKVIPAAVEISEQPITVVASTTAALNVSRSPQPAAKTSPTAMPRINVESDESNTGLRPRRQKKSNSLLITAAVSVVVLVGGAFALWQAGFLGESRESANAGEANNNSNAPANSDSNDASTLTNNASGGASPDLNPSSSEQAVFNIGTEFWVSPTSGAPVDLRYLPAGAQAFLAWRPAEWYANPMCAELLSALPPVGAAAEALLKRHCGLPPGDVELITVAILRGPTPDMPRTAAVVRTIAPVTGDALKEANPALEESTLDGHKILQDGEFGFYLPADDNRLICSAPIEPDVTLDGDMSLLQDALLQADEPAPLNREMAVLQRSTDEDRLLSVMFMPHFFFTEFKAMWSGASAEFAAPVRSFFAEGTRASLLSFHFANRDDSALPDMFLEWRAVPDAELHRVALAGQLRDRINALPRRLEDMLVKVNISAYSKPILFRFPRMLEVLSEQTEAATTPDDQVVLRCFLPAVAAGNLAFAAQLAMIEASGTGPAVPLASGNASLTFADTAELLAKKEITLVISRDTLEETINKFAAMAVVTVKIDGADLQLEGIAKNKSLGTEERDKPAGEVLRAILQTADSRLVYVIRNEQGEEVIHITTRAAAEQRGETIPPEFADGGED